MATERYLSEKEVSKITGLAIQTLRNHRHIRKGIPYCKISERCVRYRESDVYDFMNARRIETAEVA